MPPKPKFSREEIIDAAYEVARESGIDAVVARTVGKKLNSTSTPIFTFFSGMDELKAEVYRKAKAECIAYLGESINYFPSFKEFGMRWIRFAVSEPNIYKLLYTNGNQYAELPGNPFQEFSEITSPVLASIIAAFGISDDAAKKLLTQMIIYANGIAMFAMNQSDFLDEATVSELLSEVCISLVVADKIRNGSFEPEMAKRMLQATHNMPVKKD